MTDNEPKGKILAFFFKLRGLVDFCNTVKPEGHFLNGHDFVALTDLKGLQKFLLENSPQILFMDASEDVLPDALKILERMRTKNPQLVAVSYQPSQSSSSYFDASIDSSAVDVKKNITAVLDDFYSGKLRIAIPQKS